MEFYSLVCKTTGELLYDVVEFETNEIIVIYCHFKKDVRTYTNIDVLKEAIKEFPNDIELIKDGVEEVEELELKSRDILYSV